MKVLIIDLRIWFYETINEAFSAWKKIGRPNGIWFYYWHGGMKKRFKIIDQNKLCGQKQINGKWITCAA